MKTPLTFPMLTLLLAAPAAAVADDNACWVPMAEWQSRDAVVQLAEQYGWTVRRIKIDDGCYEIIGFDPHGKLIEALVNPKTLEFLGPEAELFGKLNANQTDNNGE